MLTKGNFTRGEWNHLLRLLTVMKLSICSCSHFLSIEKLNTRSKRAQERRTGEEPDVAKFNASKFDIKKFERERISHVGFEYIIQPGELQSGLDF